LRNTALVEATRNSRLLALMTPLLSWPVAGVAYGCRNNQGVVRLISHRRRWPIAGFEARGIVLVLQRVANYLPPVWAGTAVIHFDLTPPPGGTLEQSVAGALMTVRVRRSVVVAKASSVIILCH
jgi:hypothetical protein